ncbi:hypothetical protein EZV62_014495 [Acer yangbiense]|uniref:SWIM-type domain-containing protein n=1 Tax=Acer yangbiense TaxID=1000413 RepID=A0A5C7HUS7_9ROSI|nr:hypothetical protein EZV62_014495 [Acer yangbiense]
MLGSVEMDDIFKIYVTIGTRVVELGTYDGEHISMIVILHTLSEKETGRHEVPTDEYRVWVYLPWSVEKQVTSDSHLLEVFRSFSEHKETKIMFEIEKIPYIPVPPAASSFDIPNPQPSFMIDLNDVDFSGFVDNIFYSDGDNYDVRDNDHVGADGLVTPEVLESMCEMPDEISNYDLFEGYQSNSEDEFCSDFDDEGGDSKLATVMKNNPFKQLEGFNFKKIKNDKTRLTWACLVENYPWRLHASIVGDETTMQVKTYNNDHTCHRIYKIQEARSKWIATAYINLQTDTTIFQMIFVSFEAQKMRFLEGCRPFIGIDGCHLKGPYGGVLLSAVALDANSGLYPLYPEDRPICFMSNKQKSVIGALKMYWPKASVLCKVYLCQFQYSGQKMRKLFWKASKTGGKHEFKKCLQDIGSINHEAIAYLAAIEPCHLSRHAFDNSIKCDHVTNNMTEAFDNMLKDFRSRTYLGLMEYIRRMVISRFQLRKVECSRWGNGIPPAVNMKIKENSMKCKILRTLHSGQGKYEMLGLNMAYTANLNEKTCECGQWQVSEMPCCHALAGIRHHFGVNGNQSSLEEFIDPALSKAAHLRTYNYMMIHPIPDLCIWADHVGAPIQPPPLRRKP